MLHDWTFYAAAIPAVVLVGLSKGGFGGAMALLGVPLMALAMPPVQAAAILLPILLVMDAVSLWSWRGWFDRTTLVRMLPGAVFGIFIGWLTATMVEEAAVRLLVGIVALAFVLRYWTQARAGAVPARPHRTLPALFWSSIAGFTSFVAHAGGPPYQVYTMPLKLDPKLFTGTSVVFFAIVNVIKLVPYFALGQFDTTNLTASAIMVPVAIASTFAGAAIVKRMRAEIFYPFMYVMVFLVSLKLVWDGVTGLLA